MNRTSTSLAFAGSGSYPQSGCRCHDSTTFAGGSHSSTRPHSHSVPSVARSYQRPPSLPSRIAVSYGCLPMWCVDGHHPPKNSVKILKARSRGAFTTTLFTTGARVSDCMRFLPSLGSLLECSQSVTPKLIQLPAKTRHSLRVHSIDTACAHLLVAHQSGLLQNPQ